MVRAAALLTALAMGAALASDAVHVRVAMHHHRRHHKSRPNSLKMAGDVLSHPPATATINLRDFDEDNADVGEDSIPVDCPAEGDPLAAAMEPALTTACPLHCASDSICIYYPQKYRDRCVSVLMRSCYKGDSCGFQCISNPTFSSSWYMTLFNQDVILDEVTKENSKRSEDTVAFNASLITSWVGSAPNSSSILYITGNEPANNFESSDLIYQENKVVPPSGIVPFKLPMASFDNLTSLQYLRITNLQFDHESTSSKRKLSSPWLSELFLSNMGLDYYPVDKDGVPYLSELDLSVNRLQYIDANALPSDLTYLNLSDNAITVIKKGDLPESLERLDLTGNPIKEIHPQSLPSSLTVLLLQYNQLTAVPADVANMTELRYFYADGNKFGSIPDGAIRSEVLEQLSLYNCSLTNVPTIVKNMSLLMLDLSYNDLSMNPDFSLLPTTLRNLYLIDTKLQEPPKALKRLGELTYITLLKNPKAVANLDFLPPTLMELDLEGNDLDAIPQAVRNLTELTTIWLEHNPLSRLEPGSFPDSLLYVKFVNASFRSLAENSLPTGLQTLKIHRSALEEVPNDVQLMADLDELVITGSHLRSFSSGSNLSAITSIDLSYNQIKRFEGRFPALTFLDLRDNALTSLASAIAPALETLHVANNNLTAIPRIVFDLPKLELLNLTGNPIRNYTPSMDDFAALARIPVIVMDQSMFMSGCKASDAYNLRGYTVCPTRGEAPTSASSSSPPAPVADTKNGESQGTSAGLVLLNLSLILSLCGVVVLLWRRRQLLKQKLVELDKKSAAATTRASSSSIWGDPLLLQHRLDDEQILRTRLIGSGMYGEVWVAHYKSMCVAVKRLKNVDQNRTLIEDFVHEIKTVATLDHPRIVRFIGVVWTKESDISLVTEFMDGGDLRTYLDTHPKSHTEVGWSHEALQIALDITEAIVYLHSLDPVVLHRDLKSRNVLLDTKLRAKVSDFGVSRHKLDDAIMTAGVGTIRWVAPEVLAGQAYDESADIYSLGMILSELDTHKLPFEDTTTDDGNERLTDSAIAGLVLSGSLSSSFSESCPSEIRSLAEGCTAFSREQRPTAMRVAYELRRLLRGASGSGSLSGDPRMSSVSTTMMDE